MSEIDILGLIAGFLTTISAFPQLYYSYRTKDVKSIQLHFLIMLMAGLLLWALYGVLIWALPVIIFNLLGVSLWAPVLWIKLTNRQSMKSADRN